MRARAPAPPTVWLFGIFSIVPLFVAAWVYCYGPLNLRGAGLLGLLGYATALLSFLGGVRCGLEFARRMPRWRIIGASLIAPFFAFFILLGAGSGRFDTVWQVSGLLLAFLLQREGERDGGAGGEQGAQAGAPGGAFVVVHVPDPLEQEGEQQTRDLPDRVEAA